MRANVYFDGAGGSNEGLTAAGFTTTGYENWCPAIETSRANGHFVIECDLSDPANDALIYPGEAGWFSPPCQPFSAAGDGEGEFDDRDGFPWTLRIIAATHPAVVFIENVKGLTFAKHSDYFGGILATIRGLGYELEWKVLNAADYGVPQTRERCIIIARNDGGPIVWPAPTHTEQPGMFTEQWVSMAQALGWGLPTRPAYTVTVGHVMGSAWVRNRVELERDEGQWLLDTRRDQREDGTTQQIAIDRPAPSVTGGRDQWIWTRPATTINGDTRVSAPGRHDPDISGSQQADAIRLTIPELATLQGFPPDYIWCGTKTAQAKQVGNAVPPALARVIAAANRPVAVERAA